MFVSEILFFLNLDEFLKFISQSLLFRFKKNLTVKELKAYIDQKKSNTKKLKFRVREGKQVPLTKFLIIDRAAPNQSSFSGYDQPQSLSIMY